MANIDMQLGSWLVGIRPDVDRTAKTLRALFGAYDDDTLNVDESNFSVRRPGSRMRPHPGEFYIGGDLALRSDLLDDLVHALVGYASGVAADAGELTTTKARVFARGGRVVLVDAPRPALVDDGELPADIVELALWEPKVDPTSATVVIPEMLEGLRWEDAQLAAPPEQPTSYSIVGVVARRGEEQISGIRDIWRAGVGNLDEWRDLLGDLHASSQTRIAVTTTEYAQHIDEILQPAN